VSDAVGRRFAVAVALGMDTGHACGEQHIEWRVHVGCWAASLARHIPGDFVECGVNTGILARAIIHYIDFDKMTDRRFHLVDTFEGPPPGQYSKTELERGFEKHGAFYTDVFETVRKTFAPFPNVVLVRGPVPQVLPQIAADKIAYLSIDMNAAAPEIAAARHLWDRLSPGGVILLDDYAYAMHGVQLLAFNQFAEERGIKILSLPTGQGLIIKPPA